MVINIVIQFVMRHIHIMLHYLDNNVYLIAMKHLSIIHKNIFVFPNAIIVMLNLKLEIFVMINVHFIFQIMDINIVYHNVMKHINTYIIMNKIEINVYKIVMMLILITLKIIFVLNNVQKIMPNHLIILLNVVILVHL